VFAELSPYRFNKLALDGISVWMISPEDLIIRKLLWSKDSMSEMQIRDVENIFFMCEDLDVQYLQLWIKKLGLQEQYSRINK